MVEIVHERVKWDVQDGVARITLSSGAANALDLAMSRALREAADRVAGGAADGSIRVAVVAAEGARFSVGGDLRDFSSAPDPRAHVRLCADELHSAIGTLDSAPAPVVSIVHGSVAGGGIGIALAADIVVVAEDAEFRTAYTAAGLSPDCGLTWVLARRLGAARALDLTLTNRTFTGADAAAWGLASRAVPAAALAEVEAQIVATLRSGPRGAFAQTKRLIRAAADRDLAAQLNDEAATVTEQFVGPEGTEGVSAFFAKRAASFG